mgnify:CR=1 FL=1
MGNDLEIGHHAFGLAGHQKVGLGPVPGGIGQRDAATVGRAVFHRRRQRPDERAAAEAADEARLLVLERHGVDRQGARRRVGRERPHDFDAATHLNASIANLPRRYPLEVQLLTDLHSATLELGRNAGMLVPNAQGVRLTSSTG